ncbi:uncharacterized protein LOC119362158 [Triticum dicoccoides]|uniref:uncharacterized protein LOC119362158 n=1 Tax=Triticum dicoccoides TaxID=85692 RepID=UPI00188EA714|nr:uncharacterized protein LOC119362158 [Triticum dicoccoides]
MAAAMVAARSGMVAGTSPSSQRLRDLPVWDRSTVSSRCFCSAVREEIPWTPMSSSAALTPIQAPAPATLCRERSEGAAGRKMKNGMHLRREGMVRGEGAASAKRRGRMQLKPLLRSSYG